MKFKQLFAITTILLLAFVVGCSGKTEVATEPTAPVQQEVKEVVQQPEIQEKPKVEAAPAEPEEEPEQQNEKFVAELLEKYTKVKSMTYMYQDPSNYPVFDEFFIKGDKIAIKYTEVDQKNPVGKIDTIYLDRAAKKAVAYCERGTSTACSDKNKEFALTYTMYNRRTPVEWIQKVGYAEEVGREQLDQRNVIILETSMDGKQTKLWVDSFYGVPLKIDYSGDEYRFQDPAFNNVKEEDLEHQIVNI